MVDLSREDVADQHRRRGRWATRRATPATYLWGPGSRFDLIDLIGERDLHRIVILASNSVWSHSAWAKELAARLGDRVVGIRSDSQPHTPDWLVIETADWARGLDPDAIVTLGGGSVADWGKAVRFALAEQMREVRDLDDYTATRELQQLDRLASEPLPQLAVPTTLSGSESTWSVTILRPETAFKDHIRHVSLAPEVVVFDSETTLETPGHLWSASGMKALEHAVEKGYTRDGNRAVDTLSTESFRLLVQGLLATNRSPDLLAPRTDCQLALMMTMLDGRGVHKGLCQVIGWQLGAHGLTHGDTSAVMLPHVMDFNEGYDVGHFARLSAHASDGRRTARQMVVDVVEELQLPTSLARTGIEREELPRIADKAYRSPNIIYNPRTVTDPSQILEVLEAAYEGSGR